MFTKDKPIFDPMTGSKASRIKVERSYDVNRSREEKDYRESDLFPWIFKNVELLRDVAKRFLLR